MIPSRIVGQLVFAVYQAAETKNVVAIVWNEDDAKLLKKISESTPFLLNYCCMVVDISFTSHGVVNLRYTSGTTYGNAVDEAVEALNQKMGESLQHLKMEMQKEWMRLDRRIDAIAPQQPLHADSRLGFATLRYPIHDAKSLKQSWKDYQRNKAQGLHTIEQCYTIDYNFTKRAAEFGLVLDWTYDGKNKA